MQVKTAIPFDNHRSTPLAAMAPFTALLQNSGIDYLWLWDELSGWFPSSLWRPELAPMAAAIDVHSNYDPFVQAGFALAQNPKMNVRLTTDGLRSGPAELLRRVLTLAHGTEGQVVCAIGAGEVRQSKPFGHKRAEGLERLEETFRLIRELYESDDLVSYEGKHWNYKNAFIGRTLPKRRPEFWALGGGPKLLDIAARYADGIEAMAPQAIVSPAALAVTVKEMREKVASHGRDPNKFGFGIWLGCVSHDDPNKIQAVVDSPLMKYLAGMFGRLDQSQWQAEGLQRIMPEGWHYAMRWMPHEQSVEEVNDIVARVPEEMVRKGFHCGSPAELATLCREYADAGASFIGVLDFSPLILGPEDGQESVRRSIEMFAMANNRSA